MAEPGSGEGEGEGGKGPAIDFNSAEIQDYVKKRVDSEVAGLKGKNDELLGKLKDVQGQLKQFDGIDPTSLQSMIRKFSDAEDADLLKQGRIDDVIQRRTALTVDRYNKQLEAKDAALAEAQKQHEEIERQAQEYAARYQRSIINNRIAAGIEGLRQKALPIVAKITDGWYQVDDQGQIKPTDHAPLNAKGEPLPFDQLRNHLIEEQEFLFEQSRGGNLPTGKANGSGTRTYTRAQFDDLGQAQKRAVLDAVRKGEAQLQD